MTSNSPANSTLNSMPKHVAIIMDGNGRWATKRFLPRVAGHAKGVDAVRKVVKACVDRNIGYLTLFAFSSENWRRPQDEVSLLMRLFTKVLEVEVKKMHANNIRLKVAGDLTKFDPALQATIQKAEAHTAANTGLTLTICANYGGRWDIVQACNAAASKVAEGDVSVADIAPELALSYAPDPDLLIRTGGESRISNFLLWQTTESRLCFTETYWPDFGARDLVSACLVDACLA
jgi:undecaprenyl diphosphate synthase